MALRPEIALLPSWSGLQFLEGNTKGLKKINKMQPNELLSWEKNSWLKKKKKNPKRGLCVLEYAWRETKR